LIENKKSKKKEENFFHGNKICKEFDSFFSLTMQNYFIITVKMWSFYLIYVVLLLMMKYLTENKFIIKI